MRIVGYIEHPKYKITIMHMNLRYALKFEIGGIEQTYKIRESETITGPNDLEKLITPEVLSKVDQQFVAMEEIRHDILKASILEDEDEFEEII
jgi:hypothetical protein